MHGLLRTDELAQLTGYRAPDGDYETLAGLILTELGRIPEVDDEIQLPLRRGERDLTWYARILEMDGHRIDRVLLVPGAAPDPENPDGDSDGDRDDSDDAPAADEGGERR